MLDNWISIIKTVRGLLPADISAALSSTSLKTIREGLKTSALVAPVIPYLSDDTLVGLLQTITAPKLSLESACLAEFDPKIQDTYNTLLPLCFLGCLVQGRNEYERSRYDQVSAKLACFFCTPDDAISYLKQFERSHASSKFLFEATSFRLPERSGWSMVTWQALAKRHLHSDVFKKLLPYIANIEAFHRMLYQDKTNPQLETYIQYKLQQKAEHLYQKESNHASLLFDRLVSKMHAMNMTETDDKTESRYVQQILDNAKAHRMAQVHALETETISRGQQHPRIIEQAKSIAYPLDLSKIAAQAKSDFNYYRRGKKAFIQARLDKVKLSFQAQYKNMVKQLKQELMESEALHNNSPKTLKKLAQAGGYLRSPDNMLAAELLIGLTIPEEDFNTYLDTIPAQVTAKDNELLPALILDGREVGLGDFYVRKLSADDPRGAFLGFPTGCCQNIGSIGESFALFGSLERNACFYVIVRGHPPSDLNESTASSIHSRDIVGMTLSWRNPGSSTLVFDSFENNDFKISQHTSRALFYEYGKLLMQADPSIRRLLVDYDLQKLGGYAKTHDRESIQFIADQRYKVVRAPRAQMIFMEKDRPQLALAIHRPDVFLRHYREALHLLHYHLFSITAKHYFLFVRDTIKHLSYKHSSHIKEHIPEGLSEMLRFALDHSDIDLMSDSDRIFFTILDDALNHELSSILMALLHHQNKVTHLLCSQIGRHRQPVIFRGIEANDPAILNVMLTSPQCHPSILEQVTFNTHTVLTFALINKHYDALALILNSDMCSKGLLEKKVDALKDPLIKRGAISNYSVLHLACYLGDEKGAELILSSPAFSMSLLVYSSSHLVDSILSVSITEGHINIVACLLSSHHIDKGILKIPNQTGLIPLMQAVTLGNPKMVACLLDSQLCPVEQIKEVLAIMRLTPDRYESILPLFKIFETPNRSDADKKRSYPFFQTAEPGSPDKQKVNTNQDTPSDDDQLHPKDRW